MFRYLLVGAGVTLLAALGMCLDRQSRPAVEPPKAAEESGLIHASGRVEGATPEVAIRSEVYARIAKVCVREGDIVQAGALLVQLDSSAAEQQVARMQAQSDLAAAELLRLKNGVHEQEQLEAKAIWEAKQAELNRAQKAWDRTLQLSGKASVSQQDLDNQRSQTESLAFQVAAAKARWAYLSAPPRADELQSALARCAGTTADLQLAKINLAKTEIRAPADGQVVQLECDAGELTGPESAEPLVLLADTSKLRVRTFVEELDSRRIHLGHVARVKLEENSGSLSLVGTVVELAPRMSRKQSWSDLPDERFDLKSREVVIELQPVADLPLGTSVDVEIQLPAFSRSKPMDVSYRQPNAAQK